MNQDVVGKKEIVLVRGNPYSAQSIKDMVKQ